MIASIAVNGLPFGFDVEFNALYKHVNYDTTQFIGGFRVQTYMDGGFAYNRWEFPIMAKHRLPAYMQEESNPTLSAV